MSSYAHPPTYYLSYSSLLSINEGAKELPSPGDKDKDYVSTVDWSDGGVRDNVMKVIAGLMDHCAPVSERRLREKGHDPIVLPW